LGITVTKKACPRAVDRNRVKRLVREAYRQHRHLFPARDIVIIARRGAEALALRTVVTELERAQPALLADRRAPRPGGGSRCDA
jgi:ribonuclease P protein component